MDLISKVGGYCADGVVVVVVGVGPILGFLERDQK